LNYWQENPEAMLKQIIDLSCPENYSLRDKELTWEWAHETSPEMWRTCAEAAMFSDADDDLKRLAIPVLVVHGQEDKLVLPGAAEYLQQKISDSKLVVVPASGHGFIRTWPQVGLHMLDFLKPETRQDSPKEHSPEGPKLLWISSPIGLGHVRRDLAIVSELRKRIPGLAVEWLSVEPARSVLRAAGEQIHPLSKDLFDECLEFERHANSYCLDVVEAVWEMDKLLNNNFMVFTDAVRNASYDLVVGDESWEVAQYLHYNPSLKNAPFVFMTDFAGASNVSDDETRQAHVHAYNGIWVEMRELHPEASDLSVFIGEPEDIPDTPFGDGLPNRREWTRERFQFSGYVLPFDPADYGDREELRAELGFSPEEKILLVAVGGTSVGRPLIEKCLEAHLSLREAVRGIRTVVLCGSRIDPKSFGPSEGVEFHPVIQDPIKLYAACDLAVVQGGLSTTMELTALGRPFLYFPLKDHFEQQECVDARLRRYGAGVRMEFDHTSPSQLAEAVAVNLGAAVNYRPVNTDGAEKAAAMIIELLQQKRSP
jgi:UDP:flavonoid glycosyltransferase YjiC (YdhE family)